MRTTQENLYSADTSATESTHSGLKNLQRVHNLLSTHQIGSPGQQLRLKRSLMRHNWKNLSFDLRERESETEVLEVNGQPQEELEDLDRYVQEAEEEETETIETVKQVLGALLNIFI